MKNAPLKNTIDDYFAPIDIHEVRRERHGGAVTLVAALLIAVFESFLISWVIDGRMSILGGLIIHAVIVAALFFYARAVRKGGREARFAALLLLTTATTGPFGSGGVALAILLYLWSTRNALRFEDWFDSIFPSVTISQAQQIHENIVVGRDESAKTYSVIPFLDVISFGSEVQKRQALAKMTSNFHPNFAPAFRKALNDPSNMIRVQAATAITKIENQFTGRLIQLSALLEAHPREPVVMLALATHYDNYAYTGLLDAERESVNRKRALELYRQYLQLKPSDLDVHTRIGRLLMRSSDYQQAVDWFRHCFDKGMTSPTLTEWYSEALFAGGRFAELRRYSAEQPATDRQQPGSAQPPVRQAMALWASAGGRL